ncbi:Pentatricopeptide repeat-containing protein [Camellia lanceoleosa]|uniref:Pentatricopeptide repeat-containing protein n=1 Tax=Camellia lanceoleosa TaxID=1840588 RepID=A0ACC0HDH1_9ERIC|nr:Pentatricopeptide repeat-containing protein [Camellia lanceoleosa]
MEDACYIFESMSERDVVSWNAMIGGYAVQGFADDALRLIRSMLRAGMIPDSFTLGSIMKALVGGSTSLDLGRQIHALVLKCQSKHDVAIGNTLIDMYSKSGEIEDVKQVFNEMEQKNVISWTSLIAGYGKNGYRHKAIAMYKKMESEGLKPNDVTFLTLLFACSHVG